MAEEKTAEGLLTEEQVRFYSENGYLVIPDFASPKQLLAMEAAMEKLVSDWAKSGDSEVSVFTTKESRVTDKYFMDSGDDIGFFYEERAFESARKKELCVNKVGHALHDKVEAFREFSYGEKVKGLASSLGYRKPVIPQSMYIFKQPQIGGEVRAHQDSTFLFTDPPSVLGVWVAIHEATKENGCLWAVPGSHRDGVKQRFVRDPESGPYATKIIPKEGPTFDLTGAVPLPVKPGTAVLIHGALVHYSEPNTSDKSRHAYTIHLVESDGVTYSKENWLQRKDGTPFPLLY